MIFSVMALPLASRARICESISSVVIPSYSFSSAMPNGRSVDLSMPRSKVSGSPWCAILLTNVHVLGKAPLRVRCRPG